MLLVLLALSVEIALRAKCDGSQPVSCTLDSWAIVSTDSRSCRPALDEPVIFYKCYSIIVNSYIPQMYSTSSPSTTLRTLHTAEVAGRGIDH